MADTTNASSKGAETSVSSAPESLQQTISRVVRDGVVDKKELEELISRCETEKKAVTENTSITLTHLDTFIKNSLHTMLENGLKIDSEKLLTSLKTHGYKIDDIKVGDKVTLDSKDATKITKLSLLQFRPNSDRINISTTEVTEMRKNEYIDKARKNVDENGVKSDIMSANIKDKKEFNTRLDSLKNYSFPSLDENDKPRMEQNFQYVLGTLIGEVAPYTNINANFNTPADVRTGGKLIQDIIDGAKNTKASDVVTAAAPAAKVISTPIAAPAAESVATSTAPVANANETAAAKKSEKKVHKSGKASDKVEKENASVKALEVASIKNTLTEDDKTSINTEMLKLGEKFDFADIKNNKAAHDKVKAIQSVLQTLSLEADGKNGFYGKPTGKAGKEFPIGMKTIDSESQTRRGVRQLQHLLSTTPADKGGTSGLIIDGLFGKDTLSALKKFVSIAVAPAPVTPTPVVAPASSPTATTVMPITGGTSAAIASTLVSTKKK